MSPQFSRELRHLQNQLQKHADAISNAAQLMLQSREANSRFWRLDVEKVLQGARAIYRLSTESLRPALYDDGRPTVENEIFVIRHELRGLLNNVFGRCDLISNLVQRDETLSKELSFIVDRVESAKAGFAKTFSSDSCARIS
jgi:hypothetical protein